MNKDIAAILKDKILSSPLHPVIDKIAGLVRVVEYAQESRSGTAQTMRIPVSIDTNIVGSNKYKDRELIPNSSNKSIIYFEDNGISSGLSNAYGKHHISKLTMVCWMNLKRVTGSSTPGSDFMMLLLKKIESLPFNSGKYLNVIVSHENILPQDSKIFSKYTYDEKEKQYLMSPYEFFAVNLSVKYIVSSRCNVPSLEAVIPNC